MGKVNASIVNDIDLSGLPLNNYGVNPTRLDENVHTEGFEVSAVGEYSHSENNITYTNLPYSHHPSSICKTNTRI